jgi:hypothetical protein
MLWDVRARSPLSEIQIGKNPYYELRPVVSADGSHAAISHDRGPATLVDLRTMEKQPEINGDVAEIIGLTDKHLFASDGSTLQVWDWRDRRLVMGSVRLDTSPHSLALEGDVFLLDRTPGRRIPIPLEPEQWFRDLCRLSDREFTPQEKGSLPDGVDHERPCAR